eukprot:UN24281
MGQIEKLKVSNTGKFSLKLKVSSTEGIFSAQTQGLRYRGKFSLNSKSPVQGKFSLKLKLKVSNTGET